MNLNRYRRDNTKSNREWVRSQVTPNYRRFRERSVVGIRIEYLRWAGIKAVLIAVTPQQRPVQIWSCNAKKGERGNDASEFKEEKPDKDAWKPPFSTELGNHCWVRGRSLIGATRAQAIRVRSRQ
jgi:hypothetical protein